MRPVNTDPIRQIVGGNRANPKDWGWQVVMYINDKTFICGGSILNSLWIITAAHCLDDNLGPEKYSFDIGLHDIEDIEPWVVSRFARKIIVHPDYNIETVDNDIALMKLNVSIFIIKEYLIQKNYVN